MMFMLPFEHALSESDNFRVNSTPDTEEVHLGADRTIMAPPVVAA